MAGRKRYRTVLRLGISTDSHDADGQVTATVEVIATREDAEKALSDFRGSIKQKPPMVSAIKRDGQPLYKFARRGITVERAARPVNIYDLKLTEWLPPALTLDLTCSPGTYVRALARDLGLRLGCGAHVTALTRLASGEFTLCDAIELDHFNAVVARGDDEQEQSRPGLSPEATKDSDFQLGGDTSIAGERERSSNEMESEKRAPGWHQLVMAMDVGLRHLPACALRPLESRRVRSGQALAADLVSAPREQLCRVYSEGDVENRLLALLRFDDNSRLWWPHKVFQPL
jgi:tRNA pseudouridine(55) synthase